MTIEELSRLSPEEKTRRLAEHFGWQNIRRCSCNCRLSGRPSIGVGDRHIPDFLSDFNAIRAGVNIAFDASRDDMERDCILEEFYASLCLVVNPAGGKANPIWNATAENWSDAALLTLG